MNQRAQRVIGPLRIESLANGGAGIARHEGRVIFVPGTSPGDLVQCRLVDEKKRYAEAIVESLLEASATRRVPPCPVASECGGCQWQHLPYSEQLHWKERLFHDTLIRQAGIQQEFLLPIVPAPQEWAYRSRVQMKCHRSRQEFVTGFFRPKSHYVVPMTSCPVIPPELNQLLNVLKTILSGSKFTGEIPQIDLALGDDGKQRAVVHYLGKRKEELITLLGANKTATQADLFLQRGRSESLTSIVGDGLLSVTVDTPPLTLNYTPGGFAQINLTQNRTLIQAVLAAAKLTGSERVLDLYCGMGNFSLPLSRYSRTVIGVENFSASIAQAKLNALANGIENAQFYARPAEGALEYFSARGSVDLLLLDPPRSGAYGLMKELLCHPVRRVIYVSCDPQTLARDLKPLLNGGYRLGMSQPIDMFPQTYHCESLTILEYLG